MANIQRADRRSRKFVILALMLVFVGGVMLLAQFESWLADVRNMPVESARESLITAFSWSVGIGTVVLSLAGCHCWWWGGRVRRARRFPLPGATVLRDTVVLEGQAAVSRGVLLQVFGGAFMLCAAGVVVGAWWLIRMLGTSHG